MKTIIKYIISPLCFSSFMYSCVELDTMPLNSDTDINYWQQPNSAIETVNSCYRWIGNAEEIIYNDGATDNAYVRRDDGKTQSIGNGSYSTADAYILTFWKNRYYGIKMCNRLTENIHLVPGLTEETRNRYLAEVRVIRALHYNELIQRFGDVPYFTHVLSVAESGSIERTPHATIIENILAELNDVINNRYLPESYSGSDQGRITHWAAMALKARILLHECRYAEVKTVTEEIISKSGRELHPVYKQLFMVDYENNKEVILDIAYALNLRENAGNYQFLPPSLGGIANITPIKELVDSYIMLNGKSINEAGSDYNSSTPWQNRDPRLEATICYDGGHYIKADGSNHVVITDPKSNSEDRLQPGTSVITTSTGYYFKKFYDNQATTSQKSGLNYPIIRFADVLLMHAEACAETETLTSTEWDKTIGQLRVRAGFTDPAALNLPTGKNKEQLIDIVRNERRVELAMEGLRTPDINRWKIAEKVMNGKIHGMYTGEAISTDNGYYIVETRKFDAAKHYLWPIPQSEKDINSNLGQNPNW